jgi:membrane AbrB-like protein
MARPGRSDGKLLKLLATVALGALGGWLATLLQLPLPWMIGAMVTTTIAALAGLRLAMPRQLRGVMVSVLGVMLGSGFTPEILARFGEWLTSLLLVVGYIAAAGAVCLFYLRRVTAYDRTTAYFCAMPGGLTEMMLAGEELGGDTRIISLIHASRILLVVLVLPFAFQLFLGYDPADRPALLGYVFATVLKLPTAAVTGPMLLSAAIHLAGWTDAKPPTELIAAAQVVMGAFIGVRFTGAALALVGRTMMVALGSTLILLAVTVVFAYAGHWLTGLPVAALALAYSPGGLAEMSLIALALGLDGAFVATHHILRILVIVLAAPAAFRLFGRPKAKS